MDFKFTSSLIGERNQKIELGPDSTVVDYFNAYQQHIIMALSDHRDAVQLSQELKSQIDSLNREKEILQKTVEDRDNDLEIVTTKLLTVATKALEQIQSTETSLDKTTNIASLKYDIDVALSANRSLERDLLLQKTENERLRNMNCQLRRELKTFQKQRT